MANIMRFRILSFLMDRIMHLFMVLIKNGVFSQFYLFFIIVYFIFIMFYVIYDEDDNFAFIYT